MGARVGGIVAHFGEGLVDASAELLRPEDGALNAGLGGGVVVVDVVQEAAEAPVGVCLGVHH